MQFTFDEKIDTEIQKSLRATIRLFKERLKDSQTNGTAPRAPGYEEFLQVVQNTIEEFKKKDLARLRTPVLRENYERAWTQKLRNYATQRQLRDAFESLVKRF